MTHSEYWAKREAEALKSRITDEAEYDKQLKRIYNDMLDACQSEINAFYGKYASKEGITLAEAKKRVSELDIKAYERKAKRYVREKDFSAKANEEMRIYNLTMKVNRLEMLKANLGMELIAGHDELEKFMGEILQGRTEDELKRQAGILGKSVKNNAQKAHSIVNASFHNAKFSDRIWMYQDLMKADLSKLLESGLIQGKNPRVLARELKKTFNTSTFNAERLMRTELARVQTEAQKQSFERNGFEEYEFIVNSGCCDICQGLNGKHFKVKDMMPGENAPPVHPHCRCSTAAYSDRKEYEEWLNFLEKGGTTEEYKKWKASNVTKVNSLLTNKDTKNDIIQSGAKSGALTSKNDPDFTKREAFADSYYQEVLGRKREYEIAAVAKNSGMPVKDIDKVFAHIFELEHLFDDGSIHKFIPDYDMAQSWIRLREGENIQEHDRILLQHELMEANIMGTGTTIVYDTVHDEVEKSYNYVAALRKYLKENNLE
jgi:SPP1 gp7 family putative phage head morphogenesis protein